MRFGTLTRMADQVMTYKYVVKNVARKYGKTVTFMPKPLFGDNGSGMHCHQSLWKEGQTLMADPSGYAGLSKIARNYVGGHPRPRPGAPGVLRADDQLLPPARAGLRGAGQPGLLAAQPLRVHPHPDVLGVAEGEAHRVPLPRPDREPVPGVLGDADGGPRRDRARARPGRAGRLRPVRGVARRGRPGPRLARGVDRSARGRPRLPDQGERLQRGPDPDLDRLEAGQRDRSSFGSARTRPSSSSTTTRSPVTHAKPAAALPRAACASGRPSAGRKR